MKAWGKFIDKKVEAHFFVADHRDTSKTDGQLTDVITDEMRDVEVRKDKW